MMGSGDVVPGKCGCVGVLVLVTVVCDGCGYRCVGDDDGGSQQVLVMVVHGRCGCVLLVMVVHG